MALDAVEQVVTMLSGSMRVLERGVYRGPHLHGRIPMIRIRLDLGALEAWPSAYRRAPASIHGCGGPTNPTRAEGPARPPDAVCNALPFPDAGAAAGR
jgi:hypothetical protein